MLPDVPEIVDWDKAAPAPQHVPGGKAAHGKDDVPYSRRSKYVRMFRQFYNSQDTHLEFPSSLTSVERMWVHKLATQWHMTHQSFGEGNERSIVVTKNQIASDGNNYCFAYSDLRLNFCS